MKANSNDTVLEIKNLKKYYPIKKNNQGSTVVKALDGVSFSLKKGRTLGVVGESGCGKSTLAKVIIKLLDLTEGEIMLNGNSVKGIKGERLKQFRKVIQMIFQDPYASLNPKWTVRRTLTEPLIVHKIGDSKADREDILNKIMQNVGLDPSYLDRYPHEFSGGQRQRIGIARALILNPQVIIADEPVSALDISVQSQILNLLKDLQEEFDLTYMFITHDLSVLQYISDQVIVMYLGKVVEFGDTKEIFKEPKHPYTKALISAIPSVTEKKVERIVLKGDLPSPSSPPSGCHFHTRCPYAMDKCKTHSPELVEVEPGSLVACHIKNEQLIEIS